MSEVLSLGEVVRPNRPRVKPETMPDVPFIGMEHVEAHTMKLLGTVPAATMKSSAIHFKPGDVLYGRLRPYLNKVFRPTFEGLCSAEFIVFPENERLDGRYLQYFLNSGPFVRFATHLNAGDRPRVDFDQIAPHKIPVPSPERQREIVAEVEQQFSRLDEAVAILQRVKANLKRYKDSVYSQAFGNDPNRCLGDLIEVGPQNGLYLPKDMYGDGVPILRIDDYQTAWIRPVEELRRVKASQEQILTWALREGDLVVNRVNSMTHLGKCVRIPKLLAGSVFESNMMRMRLNPAASPKYVEHYLASRLGKKRLTGNAKWAVNQASINQKDVRSTPIFVPDLATQLMLVAEIDHHLSIVREVDAEVDTNLKRVQALRQSILAQAFSVEVANG